MVSPIYNNEYDVKIRSENDNTNIANESCNN